MNRILLFVEDYGHEMIITALVNRLAQEYNLVVEIATRNATGGRGQLLKELEQYIRWLSRDREALPHLLIIATDSNCQKYVKRRHEVEEKVPEKFRELVVYAIPDPHIEKWLLLDSSAFKIVLGKGCNTPPSKCERALYKKLLIEAIRNAGITPLIDGLEHATDIINNMDLQYAGQTDDSLGKLLKDLQSKFKTWSKK
jgi:hypothetical protein